MFPQDIEASAAAVIQAAIKAGVMVATAESCTGGLVSGALTAIAGSSAALDRGFVTYSNEAKAELLGVTEDLLTQFGAVSEPVARAMALGAVMRSRASASVSITGVAGPGGGSAEKPVGLVHFACAVTGPTPGSASTWREGIALSALMTCAAIATVSIPCCGCAPCDDFPRRITEK